MRDTFVYSFKWTIPAFASKMAGLSVYNGIKSERFRLKDKTLVMYLYPEGFTMHHNAVGVFVDILPHTGPVLIKSLRYVNIGRLKH